MRHGKRPGYHVVAAIAACAVGAGLFLSAGTYGMAAERSLASRAVTATGKNETVTVRTQADGTIEDVHVAAKLTNGDGGEVLLDRSSLSDISCTGEDLAFERDGEDLYWEADGEDVSYQGTGREEDLPFAIRVSYTLDGKKIDPEKLAGASGHVAIRYDYDNLTAEKGETPTPFVALTALVLDDSFSDVRVVNGRVLDMGDTTMVMGYAAPDLQEYVEGDGDDGGGGTGGETGDGTDGAERDLPEYVEVEADVKGFSLDSSITVVSSDLLEEDALDFDTSELDDSVDALTDGMDELVSGSQELEGGAGELSNGAAALAEGAARRGGERLYERRRDSQRRRSPAERRSVGPGRADGGCRHAGRRRVGRSAGGLRCRAGGSAGGSLGRDGRGAGCGGRRVGASGCGSGKGAGGFRGARGRGGRRIVCRGRALGARGE